MSSQDEVIAVQKSNSPSATKASLSDADFSRSGGMACPTLSQIIGKLAPATAAIDPREYGSVSSDEDHILFDSLQDLLRRVGMSDGQQGSAGDIGPPSTSDDLKILFEKVLDILSKLWKSGSQRMVQVTETLANGSRNLGNSCADTDENRAIVVKDNYTSAIIGQMLNPELIKVVIPVLYNLCIDFEPAQAQLAADQIVYVLLILLKDGAFKNNEVLLDFVYELLDLIAEQEKAIEQSPDGILSLLIDLAAGEEFTPTTSQFLSMTNCLVTYLENKKYQDICISNHMMADVLSVLTRSLNVGLGQSSTEDIQALAQLRLKLNQTLAEVSASPLFAEKYPIDSPLSKTLKSWLVTSNDQLQICSCVMLGNLARSDDVCMMMVQDLKVHEELISILESDARGAVLHAALGFLKNLAIAGDNKRSLGDAGIIPAISRLWAYETIPQVQFAATSIARQLIISSAENITRLLETLPSDPEQTYLSLLLSLSSKTDSTPIKTEIGRIVASICRTLIPKARNDDRAAQKLLKCLLDLHKDVAHPLGAMISQTQWPVVKSEGWFALALMASTEDGAVAVLDCLQKLNLLPLIQETLQGDVPDTADEAGRQQTIKDRDNIIVLTQELLKLDADSIPSSWKEAIHNLMNDHVSKRLSNKENE
ncbi:hypothetical protein FE257_002151 [Aspergillus nanangensis]|uniref:Uncharacterized protein n=1 Tax=Aspergillus nanangensis TaxID=2582783 RepID=A0AAD4CTD9_ASPNN|nr:hypothetical protein FE257_002151 [Aspergillus nanangensis]